jgi:hypothetical protein
MYGLPLDVRFCTRCVISNQRPSSVVERHAKPEDPKPTIAFDHDGICSACRYAEFKKSIDWKAREERLVQLLDHHDGYCIVPGSGGKDSCFAAHVLATRYGAKITTVTAAPILWTEPGKRNYDRWTKLGADHVLYSPEYRERVRDAFMRFLHPFKPFVEGQRTIGPQISKERGIPLVFYGECPAERGNDPRELESPKMPREFYADIAPNCEVHYLGWYLPWKSQDNYYYAVNNCGIEGNDKRTQGSYSTMSSLDDKIDPWHYWTTLAKFGIGRATYNACEDIRDGFIDRAEGVALVRKFDQEFPSRFHRECLDFIGITAEDFTMRVDAARPPHLWEKTGGGWRLRKELA